MNYIVFINKKGSEKLAICDDNNYRFLLKRDIKNKTPKLYERILNEVGY